MKKIEVLSPAIIHRIAAGEVVERPASVIKELFENSVDAGATAITLRIVSGGLALIEVRDNGSGMSREDLEICCQRHATSKIHSIEDLESISSLGFRGEALAALSAVSQLEIISRTELAQAESDGWKLSRSGESFSIDPASAKKGTVLRIKNLFFNVPARRKFLKSESAEAAACMKVIRDLAMAHPEIRIEAYLLKDDGELVEELVLPTQSREDRLRSLMPSGSSPLWTERSSPEIGMSKLHIGVLPPPEFARTAQIFFIVNGRPVEDKRLAYVMREAFRGLIEVGNFPKGVVFVDVDPSVVDVNVHPQKKEVRWPSHFPLYALIFDTVRALLEGSGLVAPAPALASASAPAVSSPATFTATPATGDTTAFWQDIEVARTEVAESTPVTPSNIVDFSSLRVIGEMGANWILCESPNGLIVLDQHAAHERLRFDQLMKAQNFFESHALIIPLEVKVPLALWDDRVQILAAFEKWGFEGVLKGNDALEFQAMPKTPRKVDWKEIFDEIFARFERSQSDSLLHEITVWMASSLACHGSVRSGQRLTNEEIRHLLNDLDQIDWKQFCPHGRPTYRLFTQRFFEEEFHRL